MGWEEGGMWLTGWRPASTRVKRGTRVPAIARASAVFKSPKEISPDRGSGPFSRLRGRRARARAPARSRATLSCTPSFARTKPTDDRDARLTSSPTLIRAVSETLPPRAVPAAFLEATSQTRASLITCQLRLGTYAQRPAPPLATTHAVARHVPSRLLALDQGHRSDGRLLPLRAASLAARLLAAHRPLDHGPRHHQAERQPLSGRGHGLRAAKDARRRCRRQGVRGRVDVGRERRCESRARAPSPSPSPKSSSSLTPSRTPSLGHPPRTRLRRLYQGPRRRGHRSVARGREPGRRPEGAVREPLGIRPSSLVQGARRSRVGTTTEGHQHVSLQALALSKDRLLTGSPFPPLLPQLRVQPAGAKQRPGDDQGLYVRPAALHPERARARIRDAAQGRPLHAAGDRRRPPAGPHRGPWCVRSPTVEPCALLRHCLRLTPRACSPQTSPSRTRWRTILCGRAPSGCKLAPRLVAPCFL